MNRVQMMMKALDEGLPIAIPPLLHIEKQGEMFLIRQYVEGDYEPHLEKRDVVEALLLNIMRSDFNGKQ